MSFEDLQKTWQSQGGPVKVTVDAGMLLNEVHRNQRQFQVSILWRDAREVLVAFLLTGYFIYQGVYLQDWPLYTLALACFGVGSFMIADRLLQRHRQPTSSDPLKECLEGSLREVNHQIWLLKNIFWWYLLPILLAIGLFLAHFLWLHHPRSLKALLAVSGYALAVVLLNWGVYCLNQTAIRRALAPRKRELEAMMECLEPVTSQT